MITTLRGMPVVLSTVVVWAVPVSPPVALFPH